MFLLVPPSVVSIFHKLVESSWTCWACIKQLVVSSVKASPVKVSSVALSCLYFRTNCRWRYNCYKNAEGSAIENRQEGDLEVYGDVHKEGRRPGWCQQQLYASITRCHAWRLQPQCPCSSWCWSFERHGNYYYSVRGMYIMLLIYGSLSMTLNIISHCSPLKSLLFWRLFSSLHWTW